MVNFNRWMYRREKTLWKARSPWQWLHAFIFGY